MRAFTLGKRPKKLITQVNKFKTQVVNRDHEVLRDFFQEKKRTCFTLPKFSYFELLGAYFFGSVLVTLKSNDSFTKIGLT